MTFKLGRRSRSELEGVHPDLVLCVERAIALTTQDFSVHDGLRKKAEQARLVSSGASQTMESLHLPQEDGWGHAVDLVPYINRQLRWELEPCYHIALAMRQAAQEIGIRLRWGGSWTELTGSTTHPKTMCLAYIERRLSQGRRPFVDGPHYELVEVHSTCVEGSRVS